MMSPQSVASADSAVDISSSVRPCDISVVICAYTEKRWGDLVAAVESVLQQEEPVHEVVVVIDHNDVLGARIRRRFPTLAVLPNEGERGLSGARDTGVRHSSGVVVAFLDDDATADPGWSRELARAYEGAAVLGAGGWVEPLWSAERPSWWPEEFDWVVGCSYVGLPRQRSAVRNVIGANMSLRREVLGAIGSFDSRMGRIGTAPTGGEETEMYIRAHSAFPRGVVIHEPKARVRHRVGPERATAKYFVRRCWGEGATKARLSVIASRGPALSSERSYVLRTLPKGFLTALVSHRNPRRASALVLGLAVTAAGYLHATVGSSRS